MIPHRERKETEAGADEAGKEQQILRGSHHLLKMALWFRVLAALSEDPGSNHSTCMVAQYCL